VKARVKYLAKDSINVSCFVGERRYGLARLSSKSLNVYSQNNICRKFRGLRRWEVLFESRSEAWRNVKAWIVALPAVVDTLHFPSVSEPYVAWTISGEVNFQERENKQSWITN
jgi:hypothetical protein